jgi:hypothetical protein
LTPSRSIASALAARALRVSSLFASSIQRGVLVPMRERERVEECAQLRIMRERRPQLGRRLDHSFCGVELEVDDDAISGSNAGGLPHVAVQPKQIAAAVNRNGGAEGVTVDLRGHRCASFAPLLLDVEWDLEHVAAAALLNRRFEPHAGIIGEPGLVEAPVGSSSPNSRATRPTSRSKKPAEVEPGQTGRWRAARPRWLNQSSFLSLASARKY